MKIVFSKIFFFFNFRWSIFSKRHEKESRAYITKCIAAHLQRYFWYMIKYTRFTQRPCLSWQSLLTLKLEALMFLVSLSNKIVELSQYVQVKILWIQRTKLKMDLMSLEKGKWKQITVKQNEHLIIRRWNEHTYINFKHHNFPCANGILGHSQK